MSTTKPKQLSMAATTRVIWLCLCVSYWPDRVLVFDCVTCFQLLLILSCQKEENETISMSCHIQETAILKDLKQHKKTHPQKFKRCSLDLEQEIIKVRE